MNYLFFFVHPSKFHVFRHSINALKSKGHQVDILITSKDVLEDLVKKEGWDYTNIFPEGRKIKSIPAYLSSVINTVRTLWRLAKFVKNKKYDLYITDDWLVWIGKLNGTPTLVFTDDDLSIAKAFSFILFPATHIIAPDITDLGRFNHKKIGFPGYKELAYLHPNIFEPDSSKIPLAAYSGQPFFVLRLVALNSYHDVGKNGMDDLLIERLVELLQKKGKVFISSEKPLPSKYENYRLDIHPIDMRHLLAFATLFIGDSQTMTSEAAVLGIPSLRCNGFVGKINVMEEKVDKYSLSFNFQPHEFDRLIHKVEELLMEPNLQVQFGERRKRMLEEKIDLSAFLTWLFDKYPEIDFKAPIDFSKYISV